MKILLIFALYLISGPIDCSDVIGYSGGSLIIFSNIQWYSHDSKYICKMKENDCTDIIRADTKRHQVQDGRFMVYSNTAKHFLVLIRKLKPQDAGTYRFGLGNQSNTTVNLKVYNYTCGVPKIMNAYPGQNITINCNYPGEYERNTKYLDSVDDDSNIKNILDGKKTFQNNRFSMSDERSAKVFSVNISNVREADEVFYLFGVWNGDGSVRYYTYFMEMWLHVTGLSTTTQPTTTTKPTTESHVMTLAALTETSSAVCFSPTVTISVCVCAALLLIGGLGLMSYKLMHKKTQNYTASFMTEQDKTVNSCSNTDSANLYENFRTSPI